MADQRISCFVIADGGRARFVYPAADNGLHTRESFDSLHLHSQSRDLRSDRPGRSFESSSSTRHAMSPKSDPQDLEKQKFARFVAEQITEAAAAATFDDLIVVAPPQCLAAIRDALDPPTLKLLVGTLAKDLSKVPDHELWPHLQEWAKPVRRA